MKNFVTSACLFIILFFSSCLGDTKKNQPVWLDLFNGKDLSGWIQIGGNAAFEVADGIIVGTSVPNTPNSFLCTEESYSDFILEYDFKVDPQLNSGVQIRSHSLPDYLNGRVHGYQVEIDPSERAWTGGIYDEARRGWLYPLSGPEQKDARAAFTNNEWNKIRVEAIGNNIKTWVNDVPVTNLFDDETSEGFIALQVHSIRDSSRAGTQVMWRNIRIITENPDKFSTETIAMERSYLSNKLTENELAEGWKLLFNGENGEGWRSIKNNNFPEKGWKIENGILTVEAAKKDKPGGGDIITVDKYSDFELCLQTRLTPGANSGLKYFITESKDGKISNVSPEFQILDDNLHPDAKLGLVQGIRTFGALYDLMKPENKRVNPIGNWNNIRIISEGMHVEHWLNGFKVLEYERGSEEFRKLVAQSKFKDVPGFGEAKEGHILLQEHADEVSFKSIKIRTF